MNKNIGVVILAAGLATRMGRQKLLLPLRGQPLITYMLQTTASLPFADKIAVIGEPRQELTQICTNYGIPSIFNVDRNTGQSSSIKLGLAQLSPDLDGFMFLPGDQPLLSLSLLQALIACFCDHFHPDRIVVPSFQGEYRSPAVFGSSWREKLEKLTGDGGGRSIIRRHPEVITPVEWKDEHVFWDADTWDDYQRLVQWVVDSRIVDSG